MSSPFNNGDYIVQKNDKILKEHSYKIDIIIVMSVLILICTLCVYTYRTYINEINIYPYNYNTEHGDYNLEYLSEQNYVSKLSTTDFKQYLALAPAEKLIQIKKSLIKSITS